MNPERPALLDLPYKIIFAIGSGEQVIVYSTESVYPLAVLGNLHYASINDLSWIVTSDTNVKLLVASSDGYCSFISFEI